MLTECIACAGSLLAGYVAVDLGLKFPGEKYAALTSFSAHDATASYELFMALLFVGTFETIGFSQIYGMVEGSNDRAPGDFGFDPLGRTRHSPASRSAAPHRSDKQEAATSLVPAQHPPLTCRSFCSLSSCVPVLTPETEYQYKTSELLNGRLAMLAFAGVVTQSALPAGLGYGKETFPYF